MRTFIIAAAVVLPTFAWAASNPDSSFFKKAAEGGIAEVEMGKMAADKATSAAVKEFGAMMVKDHTAANEKLKGIAETKGVDLPTSASVGQMASEGKLKLLSGETFDKSYIKGMVEGHQETIKLFEKEAKAGQDAEAKAFATAALPTIKQHLKKIEAIAAEAGVKTE